MNFSKKLQVPILIRDKILTQLLEIYVGAGSASGFESNVSSCYVNQFVDDVLEILLLKNDIRFMCQSIIPLLRVE